MFQRFLEHPFYYVVDILSVDRKNSVLQIASDDIVEIRFERLCHLFVAETAEVFERLLVEVVHHFSGVVDATVLLCEGHHACDVVGCGRALLDALRLSLIHIWKFL